MCPEQWSQCGAVPSSGNAVTYYYRSWVGQSSRPFSTNSSPLTAANQKHINIYLDRCHAESSCLWTAARQTASCKSTLFRKCLDSTNTLQTCFFNDYYPGWQLARKVVHPQLQSINLTLHLLSRHSCPPLLIKQCCLSGRISSGWWSPTVRPERGERRDLGCQIVRPVRCYSLTKYGDYV